MWKMVSRRKKYEQWTNQVDTKRPKTKCPIKKSPKTKHPKLHIAQKTKRSMLQNTQKHPNN